MDLFYHCYYVFQGIPPVPKRGLPLGFFLSGSLPDTTTHPNETKTESNRSKELRGNTNPGQTSDINSFNTIDKSDFSYTELAQTESRSKSLPELDNNMVEEEYSNQLSSPSFTTSTSYSPSPVKRVTCHTYSLHDRRAQTLSGCSSEQQSDDSEMLRSNPLYQTSEEPGRSSDRQVDGMYAEVPQSSTSAGQPDNTYELIPGESASTVQSNTYESLDEMKTKTSKSTWGKSVSQKQWPELLVLTAEISNIIAYFLFAEYKMEEVPSWLQEEIKSQKGLSVWINLWRNAELTVWYVVNRDRNAEYHKRIKLFIVKYESHVQFKF